jgi:hypothetical protein
VTLREALSVNKGLVAQKDVSLRIYLLID